MEQTLSKLFTAEEPIIRYLWHALVADDEIGNVDCYRSSTMQYRIFGAVYTVWSDRAKILP